MTAMRSVRELSEKGLIVVKKNARGWNTYEVLQGKETSEMFRSSQNSNYNDQK